MKVSEAIKRIKNMAFMCENYEKCQYGHQCTTKCLKATEMAIKALEEIQQYKAIGTVEEFKALKEKNEPKKPYLDQKGLLDVKMWHCPVCNKEVISDWNKDLLNNYCHNCGQKLDWEGGATDEG